MKMASVIQIIGAITIAVGFGAIFPPLGIMVAGLLALLFGISLEKK
jgi:hypothetical protein